MLLPLHEKEGKALCNGKKSVYDSEGITFVSVASVSRFAMNNSLAEISQRREDYFSRKNCTNFYADY